MNQKNPTIIFLDIDGVLNSKSHLIEIYNKYKRPFSGYDYPFDEVCINYLKRIIELTDSQIVITSSWRKDVEGRNKIESILKEYNLDGYLLGYTPVLNQKRGIEIETFLNSLDYNPNFIILDDDSDMGNLIEHLIKIDSNVGLNEDDLNKGVKKLLRANNDTNETSFF